MVENRFGSVISFRRDKAIRHKLLELATPAPGEDDLKPGGGFLAVDFAARSHSPLGHLLAIFGHSRVESMVRQADDEAPANLRSALSDRLDKGVKVGKPARGRLAAKDGGRRHQIARQK